MPIPLPSARSLLVEAWDRAGPADQMRVERLTDAPVPEGFSAFRVGGSPRIVMPSLVEGAPFEVHERYRARIIANATGACPMCGEVASFSADPSRSPAHWRMLPVVFEIAHAVQCPATFEEDDRQWFDPRGMKR